MKKFHYAFVICLAGLLAIITNMGSASNMLGVCMPYLKTEFALTDGQTSSIVTMRCLSTLISMFFINKLYEKISLRVGISVSVLVAALGFFIIGISDRYIGFAIAGLLFGIAYGFGGMVPVSILINNWFSKGRATAIGISSCGSGLAVVVLSPIAARTFETIGVKSSYIYFSIIIAVISLVMFLILRNNPYEMDINPFGEEKKLTEEEIIALKEREKKAKNNKKFTDILPMNIWIIMLVLSLLWGSIGNPGYSHMPTMYKSVGVDPLLVASLASICSLILMISKVLCGRVTDMIGYRKSLYFFTAISFIGNALITMAALMNTTMLYVSALLNGIGYSVATLTLLFWATDMSKKEDYPRVLKMFQIAYAIGSLAFANVPGILADFFNGSYVPAYIMFSVQSLLALILMPIAYRMFDKKRDILLRK